MAKPTKKCSKCGRKKDGTHRAYCKKCQAAYNRAWRKRHPHLGTPSAKIFVKKRRERALRMRGKSEANT